MASKVSGKGETSKGKASKPTGLGAHACGGSAFNLPLGPETTACLFRSVIEPRRREGLIRDALAKYPWPEVGTLEHGRRLLASLREVEDSFAWGYAGEQMRGVPDAGHLAIARIVRAAALALAQGDGNLLRDLERVAKRYLDDHKGTHVDVDHALSVSGGEPGSVRSEREAIDDLVRHVARMLKQIASPGWCERCKTEHDTEDGDVVADLLAVDPSPSHVRGLPCVGGRPVIVIGRTHTLRAWIAPALSPVATEGEWATRQARLRAAVADITGNADRLRPQHGELAVKIVRAALKVMGYSHTKAEEIGRERDRRKG